LPTLGPLRTIGHQRERRAGKEELLWSSGREEVRERERKPATQILEEEVNLLPCERRGMSGIKKKGGSSRSKKLGWRIGSTIQNVNHNVPITPKTKTKKHSTDVVKLHMLVHKNDSKPRVHSRSLSLFLFLLFLVKLSISFLIFDLFFFNLIKNLMNLLCTWWESRS
jgi:hypothetical protein